MHEADFWLRMERALGTAYSRAWSETVVMSDLGGRTVLEALRAGVPCKTVWLSVWRQLELPDTQR